MTAMRMLVCLACASAPLGIGGCFESERSPSDRVNLATADPSVVLARLCSFLPEEALCTDPSQAMAFSELLRTTRRIFPKPPFTTTEAFLEFVEGQGSEPALYPTLAAYLGPDSELLAWTPVTIPPEIRPQLASAFEV